MSETRLSYHHIYCSLGTDSGQVYEAVDKGICGLKADDRFAWMDAPPCVSSIDDESVENSTTRTVFTAHLTRLEALMCSSIREVIHEAGISLDERVGLIIASTKGNISQLENGSGHDQERAYLSEMAKAIAHELSFVTKPLVISNACISGTLAISVAQRMIHAGKYDHVLVCGGDLLSDFILSGFNSFQALSPSPCRPYCETRQGINIGEAVATALITADPQYFSTQSVNILGAGSANDANHISGPSRTGEGLVKSIKSAMKESGIGPTEIDMISAHGTATPYNDEMEAIAFDRCELNKVSLHSLKGYLGHSLGASGLVESIIGSMALIKGRTIVSAGYARSGVSRDVNVCTQAEDKEMNTLLKVSSGFGGCNAALILRSPDHA